MEKRYEHTSADQIARDIWQQHCTYTKKQNRSQHYTIDTPPPTVSGSLHIGHIFSYTQADIIARYKRMNDHNVFYPFGFDCNGLATERFVEKKHKTGVAKLGREKFIDLCLSTTEEMKKEFVALWRTIGISADFEKTYSTIDKREQKVSQESFVRLYHQNHLYQKNEPALFCTTCRTSVAQAELDDKEVATTFNDLQFVTKSGQIFVVATTRPELLSSCVAIMYNPLDPKYQHLATETAIVPIFGNEVPFVADEAVQIDKGSGLVMCCTFGDKTDIEWFKKFKFEYKQSIGFDGRWMEHTGPLAGLKVHEAREKILELLTAENLVLNKKNISHNVNVHERCKNEIEYTVLPQWFIKVVEHKEKFIELADQISWSPAFMKTRYIDWVKNLSWDWCISRQRVFGIPFPVWYCNDCSATLVAPLEQLPVDPQETTYKNGACDQCNSTNIRPEKDVMDTWNTSSITPYIVQQLYHDTDESPFTSNNHFIPMSMRPQAHDIIRTWAFYTIIKSWMHSNTIPWKEIVISGFVLSENKEKISKSVGNAPTEPAVLVTQFAPDAIRYWTSTGTLGQDIAFSIDQIKIGQKLMTKLWNAFSFINMHTSDYQHSHQQPQDLGVINRWMFDASTTMLERYKAAFDKNEFGGGLQAVEKTFWNDFCDNYLEIIKDQFFNPGNYTTQQVHATHWTLYTVGLRILQCYAPYMPHITENIYQAIYKKSMEESSLHITQLPTKLDAVDAENNAAMEKLLEIITTVRKLKTEHQLSLKTELQTLTIDENLHSITHNQENIIKGVTTAKSIVYAQINSSQLIKLDEFWSASVCLEIK
ncbi:valine--tRNA ligase [Candidatus Babeliales bacterium]|nr:valine--tRNA ligase [Candidatus Babeliales bacterium]MBP9844155.1 valine--tRNA ligase [Candidatus Babeliales bacterium]